MRTLRKINKSRSQPLDHPLRGHWKHGRMGLVDCHSVQKTKKTLGPGTLMKILGQNPDVWTKDPSMIWPRCQQNEQAGQCMHGTRGNDWNQSLATWVNTDFSQNLDSKGKTDLSWSLATLQLDKPSKDDTTKTSDHNQSWSSAPRPIQTTGKAWSSRPTKHALLSMQGPTHQKLQLRNFPHQKVPQQGHLRGAEGPPPPKKGEKSSSPYRTQANHRRASLASLPPNPCLMEEIKSDNDCFLSLTQTICANNSSIKT